ncbi:MAG: hypothetical protein K7J46_19865 [Bryobacter sp.]|jgi:hypothetical protein|nr:hypothetical protein [Bryobacter sp. CoA8 C33]
MKSFFSWILTATALAGQEASVERSFNRLYSFEFEESQNVARAFVQKHPGDPLGYAALSASYLFSEMNRLQVFSKDMFKEEKMKGEQAKRIGAEAKRNFEDALNRAKNAGAEALKKNDKDTNALLALLIATGAERDFAALVEKRYKDSYYAARASQEYALRLQAIDPAIEDVWFTRGFSEYLIGSVPFVIRWLMKIEQATGDKKKGVELMEKCARGGKHLKPFAQMMLASIYQKDKRMKECRVMLEAFAADHPDNEIIRKEIAKLPKS